jgi:ring-1,2-phenylacetyl-CoA epoxidase subunit PaaD
MSAQASVRIADIWQWLDAIPDPEVPAVSIVDLGIVRDVRREPDDAGPRIVVTITPTYSGCPAMDMISTQIERTLRERGAGDVRLETRLSPPWTTDWMSAKGRAQLRGYGIAPPAASAGSEPDADARNAPTNFATITFLPRKRDAGLTIQCPLCDSTNTECVSEFGSTACKAQYRCRDCLEPFDYFKPI